MHSHLLFHTKRQSRARDQTLAMADSEQDGLDFLLKDAKYKDSSTCFGIINT